MSTSINLAPYIDHTNLAPDASEADIIQLCSEAREHSFAAVCVNPDWILTAARELAGSNVAPCSVVGFPTGAHLAEVKAFEAERVLTDGAREIDTVIQVSALKANLINDIKDDIAPLAELAHEAGALLKVILEVALLSDEEIIRGCQWSEEFGADYVKTSTGMLKGENTGATVHAVELMRASVSPRIGVKASGGIRDRATAEAMMRAGATRLGTSASLKLL